MSRMTSAFKGTAWLTAGATLLVLGYFGWAFWAEGQRTARIQAMCDASSSRTTAVQILPSWFIEKLGDDPLGSGGLKGWIARAGMRIESVDICNDFDTDVPSAEIRRLLRELLLTLRGSRHISSLTVYCSWFGDEEVRYLGDLRSLEKLEFARCSLSRSAFSVLGKLRSLKELSIHSSRLSEGGPEDTLHQFRDLTLLESLEIDTQAIEEELRFPWGTDSEALAALPNLEILGLPGTRITGDSTAALSPLARSKSLRNLNLCDVQTSGTLPLESLPGFYLNQLNLTGAHLDDDGFNPETPAPQCHWLDLSATNASNNILAAFARSGKLSTLRLRHTPVGDAGISALKSCRYLRELDAPHVRITDGCAASLAELSSLELLNLSGTAIGDETAKSIARLPHLVHLDLSQTMITDDGAKHLAACSSLLRLNLAKTEITDEALDALPGMKRLTGLDLRGTGITDAGMDAISCCTDLRKLLLSSTRITDEGLQKLKTLSLLFQLNVDQTGVTSSGVRSFSAGGRRFSPGGPHSGFIWPPAEQLEEREKKAAAARTPSP